ncbi:hypothetical protein SISNIDRAFT_452117 [Sistotremastrum niveocremeum HHB9708]|uniref:Uncharacterized protein n=2 Tax=Sistotremastraceae TaxID=3402574 RepID=A0A164WYM3_9AGAM|nr:hypothetical protein SISNIDRAFT_452117 [Sistotremastrum niveocremeum HHB9708]KZT34753.1 hypothetical protein SISSUDRAFT_1052386 [Sistotremastrum suecicum HHB10207 ss-3]
MTSCTRCRIFIKIPLYTPRIVFVNAFYIARSCQRDVQILGNDVYELIWIYLLIAIITLIELLLAHCQRRSVQMLFV